MRIVLVLLLLTASISQAEETTQAITQTAQSFSLGKVDPIKGDLILRYKPLETTTILEEVTITLTTNGQPQNVRGSTKSRISLVADKGSNVKFQYELLEQSFQTRPADLAGPLALFDITSDDRGNIKAVSGKAYVAGHGMYSFDKLGPSDRAMLTEVVKRLFPTYPENGIKTGDVVFAISLNRIFPTDALGWNTGTGTAVARLRGISKVDGRVVAVLDWDTDLSVIDKTANPFDVSFNLTGYSLIDLSSGYPVAYDLKGDGSLKKNGQQVNFSMIARSRILR